MFQPARWKAYLKNLQSTGESEETAEGAAGRDKDIYREFHSQMLWFTREPVSEHQKAAGEHLERCDGLLADCSRMVTELEETLANTPKPSEVLDWSRLW